MYYEQFDGIFGVGFIQLTTISGFLYEVFWKKSGNVLLSVIPHFLLNLAPLFWTNNSILAYLEGWINKAKRTIYPNQELP